MTQVVIHLIKSDLNVDALHGPVTRKLLILLCRNLADITQKQTKSIKLSFSVTGIVLTRFHPNIHELFFLSVADQTFLNCYFFGVR